MPIWLLLVNGFVKVTILITHVTDSPRPHISVIPIRTSINSTLTWWRVNWQLPVLMKWLISTLRENIGLWSRPWCRLDMVLMVLLSLLLVIKPSNAFHLVSTAKTPIAKPIAGWQLSHFSRILFMTEADAEMEPISHNSPGIKKTNHSKTFFVSDCPARCWSQRLGPQLPF